MKPTNKSRNSYSKSEPHKERTILPLEGWGRMSVRVGPGTMCVLEGGRVTVRSCLLAAVLMSSQQLRMLAQGQVNKIS